MKHSLTLALLLLLTMLLHAENWMKRLPDDAYVANLSIPGSHDTGTGNGFPGITVSIYGPFGDKYARTQEKSFQDQWELGVRAFDMRPAVKDGYLNDNHGIMPTKLRFDDALYFLRDKLIENPSEFAIIHVLHASAGDDNASNYGEKLLELVSAYHNNSRLWGLSGWKPVELAQMTLSRGMPTISFGPGLQKAFADGTMNKEELIEGIRKLGLDVID